MEGTVIKRMSKLKQWKSQTQGKRLIWRLEVKAQCSTTACSSLYSI